MYVQFVMNNRNLSATVLRSLELTNFVDMVSMIPTGLFHLQLCNIAESGHTSEYWLYMPRKVLNLNFELHTGVPGSQRPCGAGGCNNLDQWEPDHCC